ncbi:MAG: CbiX/SirB N-terminal domain-containing protein [Pseudanabaenaceae cyanobacterium bins.39]|nr:CbiX/SirB N-terminal domain-containing protein [Pseudanabaenaceae cyanobacterium bins.39]
MIPHRIKSSPVYFPVTLPNAMCNLPNTALFFVTHGSRDRRSWDSLQNILAVARSLHDAGALTELCPNIMAIGGGCLEGQATTLAQQIEQFAIAIKQQFSPALQIENILVIPLFLLAGVHVQEDIPAQITMATAKLAPQGIKLKVQPYLGANPHIPHIIAQKFTQAITPDSPHTARLLVAHGSRHTGGNDTILRIAEQSQAIVAYWGIEPKIDTQITNLISQGYRKICILPYFLTQGGITEAIEQKAAIYQGQISIEHLGVPLSEQTIIKLSLDA